MRTYTDKELEAMKLTEPEKYFFYYNEDEFRRLGIDLNKDNWDLPLVYDETAIDPKADRFKSFYEMMHSENGVRIITPKNDIMCLKAGKEPELITHMTTEVFKGEIKAEPKPPKGLGFWFYFLRFVTFGGYGDDKLKAYRSKQEEYDKAKATYDRHERSRLDKIKFDTKAVEMTKEYTDALTKMGKSIEDIKLYMEDIRKDLLKDKDITDKLSDINDMVIKRTKGHQRLDFLMGPRNGTEAEEKVKQEIIEESYLGEESFRKDKNSENNSKFLIDVNYPADTEFSDHEIALMAFAATCGLDVYKNAIKKPVIGGPDKMSDEAARQDAKNNIGLWYNWTEALFCRKKRNCAGAVPLLNHAKTDTCKALEALKNDDYSKLGEIIKNGLLYTSNFAMSTDTFADNSTWVDYCLYAKEMLSMLDKNPKLKEAVVNAGFTEENFKNAKITANLGELYDKGIDALHKLGSERGLTEEQKKHAIADVIGMRLSQRLLETDSKRFETLYGKQQAAVGIEMMNVHDKNSAKDAKEKNPGQYEANSALYKELSGIYNNIGLGYAWPIYNIETKFGECIGTLYDGDNRVQEIHNEILDRVNMDDISKMENHQIIREMLPGNAIKYVKQVYPKDNTTNAKAVESHIAKNKDLEGDIQHKQTDVVANKL